MSQSKNLSRNYSRTRNSKKPMKLQQGIALLEALIAVLIFSMGVLALAGLQSAMVKNTSDAKYRAEATFIAQERLGMMWVGLGDVADLADFVEDATDISAILPNGTRTVEVSPEGLVTVTITWQLPGEAEHRYTTNARIEGV